MSSFTRPKLFIAQLLGSPTGGAAFADAHAFLQQRVTLYIRVLFFFFAAFVVFGLAKTVFLTSSGREDWARTALEGNLILLGLTVALAFEWLYLRGGLRPVLALHVVESAGTVIGSALLAGIIRLLPAGFPVPVELGLTFLMVLALVIRAAIVPSTALRTLIVGLLATLAMTIPAWRRAAMLDPESDFIAHFLWVAVCGWGVIFTIATMVVSRVIYGLHERVRPRHHGWRLSHLPPPRPPGHPFRDARLKGRDPSRSILKPLALARPSRCGDRRSRPAPGGLPHRSSSRTLSVSP